MSTASTTRIEHPHIVHRVLRFFAWFGIVFGLLGLVQLSTWSFLIRWIGTVRLLNYPPQFVCRALIDLSSIWLIAGCIGVLRGRPRGRGILFVWAVLVLGLEVTYKGTQIQRSVSMAMGNLPGEIIELLGAPLELGFPILVLCITGMRETVRATTEYGGGAFAVVTDFAPTGPPTSPPSSEVFCRDLRRCLAWVGLLTGLCAVTFFAIKTILYGNFPYWAPRTDTVWRTNTLSVITALAEFSWLLLLGGAILMTLGRSAGRKWVIGWAVLYLVLALAGGALYEMLYLYWVATKPRPEPQSTPVIAGIHLFAGLRNCAFAIIALYLLRQPEIAAADGRIGEPALPAPTTDPGPGGL